LTLEQRSIAMIVYSHDFFTIWSDVGTSSWKFWIKIVGVCIAMSQVICISFISKIQTKWDILWNRPSRGEYEPTFDNCNNMQDKNTDKEIHACSHAKATIDKAVLFYP